MLGCKILSPKRNDGLQCPTPSPKSRWSLVCQVRMSPLVAEESTTGKDGLLMSSVPHRMQNLKPLEACKCCISTHMQFEAEKIIGKGGFWYPSWGRVTKKSRLSRRKKTHNYLNPQKTQKLRVNRKEVTINRFLLLLLWWWCLWWFWCWCWWWWWWWWLWLWLWWWLWWWWW